MPFAQTAIQRIRNNPLPLILDRVPSAAAAYSLRKLRNNYPGYAIAVRRSSDNAQTNIGFTSNGDLDTGALLAFCGTGNGFVVTWFDQSGNGWDATQATAGSQPQIVASGVLKIQNSRAAIRFNSGTNDLATSASFVVSQPFTEFAVGSADTLSSTAQTLIGNLGSSTTNVLCAKTGAINVNAGSDTNPSFSISNGTLFAVRCTQNGASSTVDVNNASNTSISPGTNSTTGLGFGRYWFGQQLTGYISEAIIFKSALPLNSCSIIEFNQGQYYAIPGL